MPTKTYKNKETNPVSTYVLPRLSERVAQNERTLFTFLSAMGTSTLPEFLAGYDDQCFDVITPDEIYDYFEPLFRKEVYTSEIHQTYLLTTAILPKLQQESLESKIVKTLSLIYILEQFEKLKPTKDEIVGIFSINYSALSQGLIQPGEELFDSVIASILEESVLETLSTLTPKEEKVLKLRFGIDDDCPRTLEETGNEFSITRERIRQIEVKALRKLSHPSRAKKLKDFWQ